MNPVMTEEANEYFKNNPDKKYERWHHPNNNDDYIFTGDFYHKGVDLSANEVLDIMAQQVFHDANAWQREWNTALDTPMDATFRFVGIEFIGPVDEKWWEDKGTRRCGPLGTERCRYHKFGGNGEAYILVLK